MRVVSGYGLSEAVSPSVFGNLVAEGHAGLFFGVDFVVEIQEVWHFEVLQKIEDVAQF